MAPNTPPAATAVLALTLLGSLLPTSSFVPVASRGQTHRQAIRRPPPSSRFPGAPHMSIPAHRHRQRRQPPSYFTSIATPTRVAEACPTPHQGQRTSSGHSGDAWPFLGSCRHRRLRSLPPLTVGGMYDADDVDPLEAGPDPDAILLQGEPELLRQQQEDEDYEAELAAAAAVAASAEKGLTKKEIAEAAVAAAMAAKTDKEPVADQVFIATKFGRQKTRKATMTRTDPFMPRGGVEPNEWQEMADLAEGVRGMLVICHSGLPRDKKRAAEVIRRVKERFGHLIHTHVWWDENEELTDKDREELGTFDIWLEGPEVVFYHERSEGRQNMTDEQLEKILDDLELRVADEAILGYFVNEDIQFRLPGFTAREQRMKQFPIL